MPCKFEKVWMEDVVGDGGSRMEMSDCEYDGDKDLSYANCNKMCPGYEEAPDNLNDEYELVDFASK